MQEMFVPSLIEIGQMFHFKRFFPIYRCKNSFPSCPPIWPSGIHNYLQYFRKLSWKYELFWLSCSQGKFFLMTSPNFHDHLPFEEFMALYLNNLKFPIPKDDLNQVWLQLACWFWRIFFFRYKHKWIWFSLLSPLLTPGDHYLNKFESTLYQKAFM
jgi:hypothetical protein